MEATTLAGIFATLASECDQSRMRALCGRAGDADWPHDAAWTEWLLMLSAEDVAAAERLGLHRVQHLVSSMPPTLRSLCGAVNAASSALGRDANGTPAVTDGGDMGTHHAGAFSGRLSHWAPSSRLVIVMA